MNFSEAFETVKRGIPVYRKGWNGKGMWIEMEKPTPDTGLNLPFLVLVISKTEPMGVVPWLPSQSDLFAEDWEDIGDPLKSPRRRNGDAPRRV